ncbi:MAG: DUF996 domain-containing protein [Thermoproteota archaeon]
MDNLKEARVYGGVGSILSEFGIFLPYAGIIISIMGFVLEVLAIDKISSALNDREIFKNYLISVIVEFAGIVIAVILGIAFLGVSILGSFSMPNMVAPRGFEALFSIIGTLFVFLLAIWITLIVSAIFLKKSFDSIANKLNISMFSTVALLYLIGAATSVVIVGFLVMLVAGVLKIVAYFSIPETTTQTTSSTSPPQQPPTQTT